MKREGKIAWSMIIFVVTVFFVMLVIAKIDYDKGEKNLSFVDEGKITAKKLTDENRVMQVNNVDYYITEDEYKDFKLGDHIKIYKTGNDNYVYFLEVDVNEPIYEEVF